MKPIKSIKLYNILALCLFFLPAAYSQINVQDSLQSILQNNATDPETRFLNAYSIIFNHSSPKEAETLGMNVVYPFVKKNWKSEPEQLVHLSRLYLLSGFCYRERGGDDRDEKERLFLEKALETALKSNDNASCALCCSACAYMEVERGDVKRGHEYLYEAIQYYDKMKMYVKSSETLYVIASSFFNIKDIDGMKRILSQMEEYRRKDKSKQSLYQYNVIKKSYFELLLEKEKNSKNTIDYQLVDSIMKYNRHNTYLVENFLEELDINWMHGWAYYYTAKAFDDYYPLQTDSIRLNVYLALKVMELEWWNRTMEANNEMELKIYINQVLANAFAREGKTREAYEAMSESLSMLDKLKNHKNLNEPRYLAYQFMTGYYEKINRPAEALKYQKLLRESEEQRYENEKIQAINDMSIKYETEKKETQIHTLTKENQATQRILQLTAGLIAVLLIALLIFIRFHQLRKRNLEQNIYESALLAELKQTELEQNLKEKEQLQQQYDKLETQANRNKQKAESYNEELMQIKQQLAQKPTKTMIGKLTGWISKSVMEKTKKDAYITQLSGLDIDMLEQGYLTANEKISNMDMKYIICFAVDMDGKDMSLLFNVEPASIRTVRYRIKKKFGNKNTFKFLM